MKKGLSKREKLVTTAIELYAKRGIAETTFAEIGKKARISAQLLNYHFQSVEELHLECIAIAARSLGDFSSQQLALHGGTSAKEALLAYVEITFRWARDHPSYFQLMLYLYYKLCVSKELAQINTAARKIGRQRIENLIYKGIEQGHWTSRSGRSVEEIALEIQGLLTGQVIIAFTEPELEYEAIVRQTQKAALALLTG